MAYMLNQIHTSQALTAFAVAHPKVTFHFLDEGPVRKKQALATEATTYDVGNFSVDLASGMRFCREPPKFAMSGTVATRQAGCAGLAVPRTGARMATHALRTESHPAFVQ